MLEKLLKEADELENCKGEMEFRMFEAVKTNSNIELSIQASYAHYCSPRLTLPVGMYDSVELAIFRDNEFTSIEEVTQNKELIEELNDYYEGTVYGYVPVEIIEELYQALVE